MLSSFYKALKISFFILIIVSCKEAGEREKQSEASNEQDTLSINESEDFLFLTEWFDKVGVYKYEIEKKKYSPVWWHPRENVVMLVYKPGNFPTYFLTANKIGERTNLPYFNGLKLFIISSDLSETKEIDELGNGIQFSARLDEDNNLEVIYTEVDLTIASYVNQYTRVYDHYGKLIDSNIRTFDIQKSGFPQITPPQISTISPSGNYGVSFRGDSVYLKSTNIDSLKFISVLKLRLNKIKWSIEEKFLLISTIDLENETTKTENPETSELFIYSLSADSVISRFGGEGVKNFFTINDLLIFDDGFEYNSVINIFDLNQNKIIDVINPKHGCGLVYIPER